MAEEKDYKAAIEAIEQGDLGKVTLPELQAKEEVIQAGDRRIKEALQSRKTMQPNTPIGFVPIDLTQLPSKGKFYPADLRLMIRSANLTEIEHWSIMNDADPLSVEKHLTDLINSCVSVYTDTAGFTTNDILEGDRLHIVLEIKDLTFVESENVIPIEMKCRECGKKREEHLNAKMLTPAKEDEMMQKYYDAEKRCYVVKTKNYGEIEMRPPSIGITGYVYNVIRPMSREGKYWDKSFYTLLPYLYPNFSNTLNEDTVKEFYKEYKGKMDKKLFQVLYRLVEKIQIGLSPFIKYNCSCGVETHIPFRVPGGTKTLFIISDITDELL